MICLISGPAFADGQAGTDLAVLEAGVGARALGMGGAFTAVADNADAPYWNPAGLGWVASSEITTMQTKLSSDADHYYVSFVRPAWGGALGVSWIEVGLGDIAQTSGEVNDNNEVQNLGAFSCFSSAWLFAYGRALNDHLAVGLTGKYLTADMSGIGGGQATGYSVTPGLLLKLGTGDRQLVTVGLKLDDALNQLQWATGTVENAPPRPRLGLACRLFGNGTLAADLGQSISAGYEWTDQIFSLRLGYAAGNLTAGAGFALGHVRVDYAYVNQTDLTRANVHRVSLSGAW